MIALPYEPHVVMTAFVETVALVHTEVANQGTGTLFNRGSVGPGIRLLPVSIHEPMIGDDGSPIVELAVKQQIRIAEHESATLILDSPYERACVTDKVLCLPRLNKMSADEYTLWCSSEGANQVVQYMFVLDRVIIFSSTRQFRAPAILADDAQLDPTEYEEFMHGTFVGRWSHLFLKNPEEWSYYLSA